MSRPNILDNVADRLERGWTQHVYARDAEGKSVMRESPTAVNWCWEGALIREAGGYNQAFWLAGKAFATVIGSKGLIDWNDEPGRTQAEVVAATRKAAEVLG